MSTAPTSPAETAIERLTVDLDARSYDILIEQGALDRAGDQLARFARGGLRQDCVEC